MKIGIFGGSFNPPHKMHKNIALSLIKAGYLDKVIYVPTGDEYNKCDLVSAIDRYNMVNLMINGFSNLAVSDYELKSTLTYTYQTLDYFKCLYPDDEFYFICGTDNLKMIQTWMNYRYILNNYKLLVINRDNDDILEIINGLNSDNIIVANIDLSDVSSTMIRNMICNNAMKKHLLDVIDASVLKYIETNKLYGVKDNEKNCKVIRKKQ